MVDRKDSILLAAMSVFSQYGYHNAKIAKIAEIANIGAGTIYLSFKNKEEILEEIFYRFWSKALFEFKLIKAKEISSVDKISEITDALIDLVLEEEDFSKIILHEFRFWNSGESAKISAVVEEARSVLVTIIKDGINNNEIAKDAFPEITLAFYTGGIWHLLARWSVNKENFAIESIRAKAKNLVLYGLLGVR